MGAQYRNTITNPEILLCVSIQMRRPLSRDKWRLTLKTVYLNKNVAMAMPSF